VDAATLDRVAQAERPRLLGLAYRLIGSRTEAEDVVQEAMLRVHRAQVADIGSPAAYLTTVTTRLAIDHLRSARVRRESYVGPWLPEPIADDPAADAASRAVLDDSLSMAFLVVLEALSPDERAVLVLHDVFAYSHAEIASILDRSEASCRQLLRRARQRIGSGRTRHSVDPAHRDAVMRSFVSACQGGGLDAFLELLSEDVVLMFDGGPEVRTAARHPIVGADRVARFLTFVMNRLDDHGRVAISTLNGGTGALVYAGDDLIGAVFVEPCEDGRAAEIRWVRNPEKLAGLINVRDAVVPRRRPL
jgi:RNA polymerase sigma-70 factor (ECF subfamily)